MVNKEGKMVVMVVFTFNQYNCTLTTEQGQRLWIVRQWDTNIEYGKIEYSHILAINGL